MTTYLLRRLALIPVVLFSVMLLNFFIINLAVPAGPIEQIVAQMRGNASGIGDSTRALASKNDNPNATSLQKDYKWARGLTPETLERLMKEYELDKPLYVRFWNMMAGYIKFDFGESFFSSEKVISLIIRRMPVSISLGLWSTLLIYIVSIPLGIYKATCHGTKFDVGSDTVLVALYAIPSFLFAILLIVLFCGGSYWKIFPLTGLISDNWKELSLFGKIVDYAWHMALPTICMTIGGFTILTMMTKNFFLEEIHKQYVVTARAKGLSERKILFGHVFRNAMLIIIAGFPATLISILFTGTLLLEVVFSLNGLGLLGYESIIRRDYPVVFGTLYMSVLLGLSIRLISDLMYKVIDPRIGFESRR